MKITDQFSPNDVPKVLTSFQKKSGSSQHQIFFHTKDLTYLSGQDVANKNIEIGTLRVQLTNQTASCLLFGTILKIIFTFGIAAFFASIRNDIKTGRTGLLNEKVIVNMTNPNLNQIQAHVRDMAENRRAETLRPIINPYLGSNTHLTPDQRDCIFKVVLGSVVRKSENTPWQNFESSIQLFSRSWGFGHDPNDEEWENIKTFAKINPSPSSNNHSDTYLPVWTKEKADIILDDLEPMLKNYLDADAAARSNCPYPKN